MNETPTGPSNFSGLIYRAHKRGAETSILSSKRPWADTLNQLQGQLGPDLRRREHDPNDSVPWTSFESETVIDEQGKGTYPVGVHFTFELSGGDQATMHRHWYTTRTAARRAAADVRQAEPAARVLVGGHQVIVLRGWDSAELPVMEAWSQEGEVVFPEPAAASGGGLAGGLGAPQAGGARPYLAYELPDSDQTVPGEAGSDEPGPDESGTGREE